MYYERDSQTSRHKIILDGLTWHLKSINHFLTLKPDFDKFGKYQYTGIDV